MKADSKLVESTLSEVCTLVTDGTHDTPKIVSEGIPLIKAKEIVGGIIDFDSCDKVTEEDHIRIISRSKPEYGDTLFAHIGASLGEAAYINTRKEFSIKNVALFKPDPNKINGRYLYYLVKSPQFQELAKRNRTGSAQPFLSLGHLRSHKIKYHEDLETQQKIASILSAFDDLIENNTRRIEILEEMARHIYREWFVHFRYPGHEKDKLVDSGTELGEIPEGWEVRRIIDLYDTSAGGTPSRKREEYFGGNIPWLKTKELNDSFIYETEETITESGLKNSSAKLFPRNSVLVAMYGATVGQLGVLDMEATTNQACCAVMEKKKPFDYSYIFMTLLENRNKLIGISQGAAQQNINQGHIKQFLIVCPKSCVLEEFQQIVYPIFEQIRVLKRQSHKLKVSRDLLLPKLISGKINIKQLINREGVL